MSGGKACICKGSKEEKAKNWEVKTYKGNNSVFNGGRFTRSDYSEMHCNACGFWWRTKAAYATIIYYKQKNRNEKEA